MSHRPLLAFAAAAAVTINAPAAAAQECFTEKEIASTTIYAMPSAIAGARAACRNELSASGYMATQSAALASSYSAEQDEAWPQAKSGLIKMIERQGDGSATSAIDVAQLPDNALRPFVDALLVQQVQGSIKADQCRSIERGMQLFSRIAPRDVGAIAGFLFGLVQSDKLPVCKG